MFSPRDTPAVMGKAEGNVTSLLHWRTDNTL